MFDLFGKSFCDRQPSIVANVVFDWMNVIEAVWSSLLYRVQSEKQNPTRPHLKGVCLPSQTPLCL
jgi:hypothetical protein